MQRRIERCAPVVNDDSSKSILVVSSYGTDDKLIKTLKKHEEDISSSCFFQSFNKFEYKF